MPMALNGNNHPKMKETKIIEPTGGLVIVVTEDADYQCHHDAYTGDWSVTSKKDKQVQEKWMIDKDSAIKFALEQAGIIEDGFYKCAPDRTSA